jgi:hypothetical protein
VEVGRNQPCHCCSGKKYKSCCLDRDLEEERKVIARANNTMANGTGEVHGPASTANNALERANRWRRPKAK